MKKVVALLALTAMLFCMIPGLASAQTIVGDYIITQPGTYRDLVVTGNIIIQCSGEVILINCAAGLVSVEAADANVLIGAGCKIETVEVMDNSVGATIEIQGTVGSITILAPAVDLNVTGTATIGNIIVASTASAAKIVLSEDVTVATVTNYSISTELAADSVADIDFQGSAAVNLVY